MKRLLHILLIIVLFTHLLSAQNQYLPGGVNSIKGWYVCEPAQDGQQISWKDQLSGSSLPFLQNEIGHPIYLLNFNPAVNIENPWDGLDIHLGFADLDKFTLFVVYQLNDTLSEKSIWSWSKNGAPNLMLTSENIMDHGTRDTSKTQGLGSGNPTIGTYLHRKEKDTIPVLEQRLRIGGTGFSGESPVLPFLGKVAEVIWYDRVLAGTEKQQVETYLALKYGVPLSQAYQPSFYLDSNGDVVWDAKRNKSFAFNIAGIGRDDRSGLYQKQSTCSNEPGVLTIGVGTIVEANANNPGQFPDMNFLVWSDNNLDFELGPELQGQPTHLLRHWRVSCTEGMQGIPTSMQFDTKLSENQPGENETWWVLIDRSGNGDFPLGKVDYQKVNVVTPDELAVFNDIFWDPDNSGTDHFTFSIAPEMFAKVWIKPPVCSPQIDGVLHIGAEGGMPPYHFSLKNEETGYSFSWTSRYNDILEITGIAPGEYTLTVYDSEGMRYSEALFIQSSDAPESELQGAYMLMPDQVLCLDASNGINPEESIYYRWLGPDGEESTLQEICISTPGTYILFMDRDGCFSRKVIEVEPYEKSNFKELLLFPNPAGMGQPFQVIVALHRDATVEMEISDILGKQISSKGFSGNNYYRFMEQTSLPPGLYSVSFRSEKSIQTRKLVIE